MSKPERNSLKTVVETIEKLETENNAADKKEVFKELTEKFGHRAIKIYADTKYSGYIYEPDVYKVKVVE